MSVTIAKEYSPSIITTMSDLEPRVVAFRRAVLAQLKELPVPIADAVTACYLARSIADNAFEYGPWLIADLLDIEFSEGVLKLASSWFLVHLYTLIMDDLFDGDQPPDPRALVGAGLCLQRGLSGLYAQVPQLLLDPSITQYFEDTAVAVLTELKVNGSNRLEPDGLYKKMSIAKVWGAALLLKEGEAVEPDSDRMLIIDLIMNAMQLRDDLIDWEHDLGTGQVTPLLRRALDHLSTDQRATNASLPEADVVVVSLLMSTAYEDHIQLSSSYFSSAIELIENTKGFASKYLQERLAENHAAIRRVREIKHRLLPRAGNGSQELLGSTFGRVIVDDFREMSETTWGIYGCK